VAFLLLAGGTSSDRGNRDVIEGGPPKWPLLEAVVYVTRQWHTLDRKFVKGSPRTLIKFLETKARSVVIVLVIELHRLEL
jgi:hypothetical protein